LCRWELAVQHTFVSPRWDWLVVLGAGAALFVALLVVYGNTGDPHLLIALMVLGAGTVPTAALRCADHRGPDSTPAVGLLGTAMILGGTAGLALSALFEYDTLRDLGSLPLLWVAFIEESVKLLIVAAILLAVRQLSINRLLVGLAVGAGFAILETCGYVLTDALDHLSNGTVEQTLLIRGLAAPASHMAWTGLATAALVAAAAHHFTVKYVVLLIAVFVPVCGLHAAWDAADTILGYLLLGGLGLIVLIVISDQQMSPAKRTGVQTKSGPARWIFPK
jgi:RsiW-degrading membrane proteinase PrsW (M82 family)